MSTPRRRIVRPPTMPAATPSPGHQCAPAEAPEPITPGTAGDGALDDSAEACLSCRGANSTTGQSSGTATSAIAEVNHSFQRPITGCFAPEAAIPNFGGVFVPRSIELIVSPTGETRLQTHGYLGSDCLQASQYLEQALGVATSECKTDEFYQSLPAQQQIQQ